MAGNTAFSFDEKTLEKTAEMGLKKTQSRQKGKDPFADIDSLLNESLDAISRVQGQDIPIGAINQSIDEVLASAKQDAADLAGVAMALRDLAQKQGSELASFDGLHPKAQDVINNATSKMQTSQSALTNAQVDEGVAKGKIRNWILFKTGEKAAAAAAQDVIDAEAALEQAKADLEAAPAKAEAKHREMLEDSSLEESANHIRAMHERANNLIWERFEQAGATLERRQGVLVQVRKKHEASIAEHDKASKDLEAQQIVVDRLQSDLDNPEIERNTPAYTKLEGELSIAQEKAGQLKAKMDASMGEAQELEEKTKTLELQRDALITLKGNYERSHRIGVAAAKLNQEVTNVRVELLQGLSDLDVQNELNKVSRIGGVDASQGAAGVIAAIENMRVAYGADHPKVMEAQEKVRKLLDKQLEFIDEIDAEQTAAWRKRISGEDAGSPTPTASPSTPREEGAFTL